MNHLRFMACAIAVLAAPSFAQQTPPEALVVTAQNLMAGDARHREWVAQGGSASDVLPGDVIRYSLQFTNTQEQAVRNVVFSNPVPQGLRYVIDSASANVPSVVVTYSIDGGRTYSAQPMIEVVEDGERRNVPAPARMYTHVRWTVEGWVQPGGRVTAEFRAALPVPGADPQP